MLKQLFPRVHRRYSSLPIVGPELDGFTAWLFRQGYPRARVRYQIRATRRLSRALEEGGLRRLSRLTRPRLRACAPAHSQDDADLNAVVRLFERYLDEQGALPAPAAATRSGSLTNSYGNYLEEVRGLAASTITQHVWTASNFLKHVRYDRRSSCIARLSGREIETFTIAMGKRLCRASLQHVVSQLRSFLRFLSARGQAPPGLDCHIDTPRVYRDERLPRALPWDTVQAFLRSIERDSAMGLRDRAMFLLIATYGLRSSEIVALTLDDVEWRASRLRVPQRKSVSPLLLPLTDEVADSLIEYLRHGRPSLPYRQLFLRVRAPAGVLKPTAVTEAFQGCSRRSGLRIPFQGAHCLRHSFAVRLLRQGTPLKTIGDVLGHRTAESTCVYLRLAIDDLREVPLALPRESSSYAGQEVTS